MLEDSISLNKHAMFIYFQGLLPWGYHSSPISPLLNPNFILMIFMLEITISIKSLLYPTLSSRMIPPWIFQLYMFCIVIFRFNIIPMIPQYSPPIWISTYSHSDCWYLTNLDPILVCFQSLQVMTGRTEDRPLDRGQASKRVGKFIDQFITRSTRV